MADEKEKVATQITPMLSVRRGAKAVDFYKAAFAAEEAFRLDDESGAVVARLSVDAGQVHNLSNDRFGILIMV